MTDIGGVIWEGVTEFKAAIDRQIAAMDVANRQIVTRGGHIIEAHTKEKMSGDWPKVRSGDLRRSVMVRNIVPLGVGRWSSETAPAVVYGRRIELGFKGTDSKGRHFNQEGRFPLRYGLADSIPELDALRKELWAAALRA